MSDQWLNLLGLARRAGQLAPGENQTSMAMSREDVRLLIMATDAGPSLYRKYHLWAQDLRIPVVRAGTKATLGSAIGMGPHAVLAILDEGFARRILEVVGNSSGGIILGRKRQGQDQGIRTGKRAEARQSPVDRPAPSSQSGKHQKSYEHGRARGGQDGAGHHGGKTSSRAQTGTQAPGSTPAATKQSDPSRSGKRSASAAKARRTGTNATNGRSPTSKRPR